MKAALCAQANLDGKCRLVQADFHKLPFADATFDHCYSIEACCHSPDRKDVYREIYRCLKPGGVFISYEWVLTDNHDPTNPEHLLIKKRIEEGDGLPDLLLDKTCDEALKAVGFEMIESRDMAQEPNPQGAPWYEILTPSYFNLFRLQFTSWGTFLMNRVLNGMEMIGLAPKGSQKVREMLRQAQLGLVRGGQLNTFTPMYLVVAKKPLKKK